MHVCMYVCIYIYIYIYTCVYIYIYTLVVAPTSSVLIDTMTVVIDFIIRRLPQRCACRGVHFQTRARSKRSDDTPSHHVLELSRP